MAEESAIEWTDATLNLATGCTKVSPGCDNCYMYREYPRLHGLGVNGYEASPDVVQMIPARLAKLSSWRKPRKIFVCSMSDLFHKDIPDDYILQAYQAFANAPQHIYQVLTKRPQRMAKIVARIREEQGWPLDHVWHGTSIENQDYAWRAAHLANVPSRIRFVSAEPLLGPLDLGEYLDSLSWCIVGGESGPKARPMQREWAVSLQRQCTEAGVAYHFKQWGEHNELGERVGKKKAGRRLNGRTWDEYPD